MNPTQIVPLHHPRGGRVYSGEAVILSPAENMVCMLNPVGSRIWELVDGVRTVDEIALALTAEFDVEYAQARHSTQEFLDTLAVKGLVTWTETGLFPRRVT
ncbi:MAG: PqqD family protein [Anaerolineae bacterium]|nr:MAG: PqqD family protein [Anaerolineae bacterium]